MKKISLNLAGSLSVLGVIGAIAASPALAETQTGVAQMSQAMKNDPVSQNVTSVSQLSDVKPTDWAFTALQSLVDRYSCIGGYPDRTFRGKQATTRYEFAATLNSCLDKINEIISAGLADKVGKEDLATLQKLQEEFAAELATLRGRVDALDAKTAKLEAQQFSTTTKLRGEAVMALAAASDGLDDAPSTGTISGTSPALPNDNFTDKTNAIFSYRVRLNLDTSFTGKDLLRTRLQASNTPNLNTNGTTTTTAFGLGSGSGTRLSFESGRSDNTFEINRLFYRFPVGESITAYVAPIGAPEDVISPLNPLESGSQGTISRFGRFNPLIRVASSGGASGLAVAGLNFKLGKQANLELMYSASNAASATGQGGLTGGDTKLAAQLVYKPSDSFTLGAGYANAYTVGNTLSSGLNVDSIGGSSTFRTGISGIKSNIVVGSLVWDITKKFTFNTWGSYVFADTTGVTAASTTFTSWMAALSAKDLFVQGDLAAISFGQPLYASSVGGGAIVRTTSGTTPTTPYHLEAFYRFNVSKNISITPGVFFVFNPGNTSANGTATVGVIRTTFSF